MEEDELRSFLGDTIVIGTGLLIVEPTEIPSSVDVTEIRSFLNEA